ncbi:hypothetical protein [Leptothoe kymatousa]|uniref:Uncharacterized protein n=1 Tax=Leptothoe kymatousa TAU-MAC 1615 TaxID=2364775 RepID=A0ABS5Y340_9CYAN|nr:hypothetical protein [Leptothoe kymatousa]MBT9312264.1 hypothetical protein [Leptothoe kymatousa TAU-MAC 1615]
MSLLSVAGTAVAAEGAAAATSETTLKEGLRQAICFQDWNSAIELSSTLMASDTITPEYRHNLVNWRNRFSHYSRGDISFTKIPGCEGRQSRGIDIQVQPYGEATPRFSVRPSYVAHPPACYIDMHGRVKNLTYMCGHGPINRHLAAQAHNSYR